MIVQKLQLDLLPTYIPAYVFVIVIYYNFLAFYIPILAIVRIILEGIEFIK